MLIRAAMSRVYHERMSITVKVDFDTVEDCAQVRDVVINACNAFGWYFDGGVRSLREIDFRGRDKHDGSLHYCVYPGRDCQSIDVHIFED